MLKFCLLILTFILVANAGRYPKPSTEPIVVTTTPPITKTPKTTTPPITTTPMPIVVTTTPPITKTPKTTAPPTTTTPMPIEVTTTPPITKTPKTTTPPITTTPMPIEVTTTPPLTKSPKPSTQPPENITVCEEEDLGDIFDTAVTFESYFRSLTLPFLPDPALLTCTLQIPITIPPNYILSVSFFESEVLAFSGEYTGEIPASLPTLEGRTFSISYTLVQTSTGETLELCDVVDATQLLCRITCPNVTCPETPNPLTGQGYTEFAPECEEAEGGLYCVEGSPCRLCSRPVEETLEVVETMATYPPVCERFEDFCLSNEASCCGSSDCEALCDGSLNCCALCVNLGQAGTGCTVGTVTADGCNPNGSPISSTSCTCDA